MDTYDAPGIGHRNDAHGNPEIFHSGRWWTAIGVSPSGLLIWSIEEMLARRPCQRRVAERIAKFYPKGKEEGSIIRGWYLKPTSWRRAKRRLQESYYFQAPGGKLIITAMYNASSIKVVEEIVKQMKQAKKKH